jgi:hypothetical protein
MACRAGHMFRFAALGLALLHLLAIRNRCDACQWARTSTMI